MCGLYGFYRTGCSKAERAVIATILALENDTRGGDSWGYWTPEGEIKKGLGHMAISMPGPMFAKYKTLLAHTRFATQGSVIESNSHPFTFDTVTGAHNGVIYNSWELDMVYDDRMAVVDSEHLIEHIAKGLPLDEIEGYGAVVYTDTRTPGDVYMGRFCGGQLALARLKKGGFVWSSDDHHLREALVMAGLEYTMVKLGMGKLYVLRNGELRRCGRLKVSAGVRRTWKSYGNCSVSESYRNSRSGGSVKTYKVRSRGANKYAPVNPKDTEIQEVINTTTGVTRKVKRLEDMSKDELEWELQRMCEDDPLPVDACMARGYSTGGLWDDRLVNEYVGHVNRHYDGYHLALPPLEREPAEIDYDEEDKERYAG